MKRLLFLILLISLNLKLLHATHIVGGEMNYTCLGNDKYEITLTIFRDCFYGDPNAWFDNPASIGVFDTNNQLLGQFLVPLVGNDTLNPVLSGECFVAPPSVCVHTTTYRVEVELPFRTGGYQLAYQRCCRNQTLLNIVNPLASGATYGVTISERALLECNSNPKFQSWPPIYICVGEPINFDQSAIDADGDSIVYKLCEPWLGANQQIPRPQPPNPPPYEPVVWQSPPYGLNNMLNAVPNGAPLRIDLKTGILTGTPNTIGQFVVGICIEEYRDGELISTTRRDFQYNVGICGRPTAGFFAPEVQCGDLEVNFANESVETNSFLWQFGDGATSDEQSPSFTFADTGTYQVRLIVEPGTVCADTFERSIQLLPATLKPDFSFDFLECNDSLTLSILDASSDSASEIIDWDWLVQPLNLRSNNQNPTFVIHESGLYDVRLRLRAANGCDAMLNKPLEINLIEEDLPDSLVVCKGEEIELNPNFNPAYIYNWSPSNNLNNPNVPNPLAKPDSNTIYTAIITDSEGFCQVKRQVQVRVAEVIDSLNAFAEPDTIFGRGTSQLSATLYNNLIYNWNPTESLNNSDIYNPIASLNITTTYQVTTRTADGCLKNALVTVVVMNGLCEEPFIFIPNAFTPNADGVNDVFRVRGNHIEEFYLAIYNRWGQRVFESRAPEDAWDGTFNGEQLPPDVYGYYVELRCFDESSFVKKGNLTLIR
ncbi:MAG: gliding motility-associated C-terminal domain-containing protein [Saprospiraceae bacterium]|nr:gliding motility-associated C-terminal domain-containing protein [Saprospiraceae bacterium]